MIALLQRRPLTCFGFVIVKGVRETEVGETGFRNHVAISQTARPINQHMPGRVPNPTANRSKVVDTLPCLEKGRTKVRRDLEKRLLISEPWKSVSSPRTQKIAQAESALPL